MFWLCFLFMNSWVNEHKLVSWQMGSMHLMNGERWISEVNNIRYRWPSELLESHKIIRIVAKRASSVRIDFVWNLSVYDLVEINCVREPLIQLKDLVSLPPVSFRHCLGFFIMLLSSGVGDSPLCLPFDICRSIGELSSCSNGFFVPPLMSKDFSLSQDIILESL